MDRNQRLVTLPRTTQKQRESPKKKNNKYGNAVRFVGRRGGPSHSGEAPVVHGTCDGISGLRLGGGGSLGSRVLVGIVFRAGNGLARALW